MSMSSCPYSQMQWKSTKRMQHSSLLSTLFCFTKAHTAKSRPEEVCTAPLASNEYTTLVSDSVRLASRSNEPLRPSNPAARAF